MLSRALLQQQKRVPALRSSLPRSYATVQDSNSNIGATKVAMSPLNPDAYINYRALALACLPDKSRFF